MNSLVWLLAMMAFDGPVKVEIRTLLKPIPEDSDYFLQTPTSFDVDKAGNYYLVDAEAQVVFTWDKQGNFKGHIGKPGEGPGEFQFGGRGPGAGFITALDKGLFVYDVRKRQVLFFNEDAQYQSNIALNANRARASNFYAMPSGEFLVHQRRFNEEGIFAEVKRLDGEGKETKTYAALKDESFNVSRSERRRRFTIRAFHPTIVSHYDRLTGEILVGHSKEPSFDVHKADGQVVKIKVPMPANEVTQEDKDEYMRRFETRNRAPEVEFPDKKAFYTHLLSLGESGYLVFNQSPYYNHIEGVHLNKNGDLKGRVDLESGPGGGLFGAAGRLLWLSLDDEDEFVLKEVALN